MNIPNLKMNLFIESYLTKAINLNQKVFWKLLNEKKNDSSFDINRLTYEEMKIMCEIEGVVNPQLAFLFNTDKSTIREIKDNWNIKQFIREDFYTSKLVGDNL